MVILLLIIVIILLAVFAPSLLFLLFGGGIAVLSDLVLFLLSVAISSPIVFLLFFMKEKLLNREASRYGLNGVEINEAKYLKNEKAIWMWSIFSGIVCGFVGLFIYDSTHNFQNSSNVGMFFSTLIPFIVGIFVTYCIVTYFIVIKKIIRRAKRR